MTRPGIDKRRDKRLTLTLPVTFSDKSGDENLSLRSGVTHNVSSGGVYFETGLGPVGTDEPVWVRIGVPALKEDDKPNLTLVAEGVVRRVEKIGEHRIVGSWPEEQKSQGVYGVAVQFQQRPTIQLRSFEELLWEDQPS